MSAGKVQRYFRNGMLVQLRAFEAVARLGSFTRAAEELHMAQPTVSVHIRKLTETIGALLLEQSGKRIRLTTAGEEVYAACQRVFGTFTALDETLADIRGLKAGRLRIATTTAGEYLLPALLAQFVNRHPGIEVSLHVSSRDTVLQRFADDLDDLYLLTNPPQGAKIVAHPMLPNPLVALAPAGHPLAAEKNIAFERFARERLLVREPGSGTRLALEQAFAAHHARPVIAMELGSNEAIREAMIAGLGVALLYRYSLGFDIDERRLVVLDVAGLPKDGHWHLLHTASKQLAFVAQTFVSFASREARRIFDERIAAEVVHAERGHARKTKTTLGL
jgi:LysR family transcriptional regulator, low CO2-responsive transcriptional regulator